MFCPKCGNKINDEENCCQNCGWTAELLNNDSSLIVPDVSVSASSLNLPSARKNTYIIASAVAAALIIILGIVCIAHFNSDSYKLKKASELVCDGDYSEGIDKLSGVYDPQAELIRNYVGVLEARDAFMDSFDSSVFLLYEDSEMLSNADEFKSKVYEFNQNENLYLLPDNLSSQFNYYLDVCKNVDEVCNQTDGKSESLQYMYAQPQYVFLNCPTRNRESRFTLSDMQYNIDISKSAVDVLQNWISENIQDFSNSEDKFQGLNNDNCPAELLTFYNITNALITSCNSELESEQDILEQDLKEFDLHDRLYLTNPNTSYSSFVNPQLNYVATVADISKNALAFKNTYYVEMIAYCLNNE